MPSNSKNPQAANLGALLKGLKEAGVDFILVGGVAAVAQGAPVTTIDLDIVHLRSRDNIERLVGFLQSISAFQRRPDEKIIEPDIRDLQGDGHVLLSTDLGPLDVLATIENNRGYDDLLPDSVEIDYQGHKILVLSLEAMVRMKDASRIPEDKYRLEILKETLKQIKGE
jgi:predicted nucleotidyltransferase